MRSSAVSLAALLVLGVALVRAEYGYSSGGSYDQSGYSSGYTSGYDQTGYAAGYSGGIGGYDSGYGYSTGLGGYSTGMSGYGTGMSGYGHKLSGYGSSGHGYGHKRSKTAVYVPYAVPTPVAAPVQPAPLPIGLGIAADNQDEGVFGGNGALLALLALTPFLLNGNLNLSG
ncbi:keratin-associated protein 6-2-like [Saccostrea echinata]|uniref:keratin-associated protein 6-2-like n=1 Tax=Saccostrea echinata TaxID=191078 RepID=UPI002A7FAD35|nr:keratin-associated protein 6-2-like [Saccostrea echinata]